MTWDELLKGDPDRPIGSLAWWRYEDLAGNILDVEEHAACEAPRHLGRGVAAVYVMAVVIPEEDFKIVQGMCLSCLDIIARDLGKTPESGALAWQGPKR